MDDGPTYEELERMVIRSREERRLLCDRLATLEGEKAALMAIVQELQRDLQAARSYIENMEPIPG